MKTGEPGGRRDALELTSPNVHSLHIAESVAENLQSEVEIDLYVTGGTFDGWVFSRLNEAFTFTSLIGHNMKYPVVQSKPH